MIDHTISNYYDIPENCVPSHRQLEFKRLMSQTTMQERETAYALARYVFSGDGEIFDVGAAAGGSSYCFAAGVLDSEIANKRQRVVALDKFDGYSMRAFQQRITPDLNIRDDMALFRYQTMPVADALDPIRIDLNVQFPGFRNKTVIEIAHIDAAKTLETWRAIVSRLLETIIPGKTVWIFQDFVRIRLPWHAYAIAEIEPFGHLIGGSLLGTLYFLFDKPPSSQVAQRLAKDAFTLEQKVTNVNKTFTLVEEQLPHIFGENLAINDLHLGTRAYCHFWFGNKEEARSVFRSTSSEFRSLPGVAMYKEELGVAAE